MNGAIEVLLRYGYLLLGTGGYAHATDRARDQSRFAMNRRSFLLTGPPLVMVARRVLAQPSRRRAGGGILNYAGAQDTHVNEKTTI